MPRAGDVIDIDGRRFQLEDGIGAYGEGAKGGFGLVFAARELDGGEMPAGPSVAIKLVNRADMEEHRRRTRADGTRSAKKHFIDSLQREIDALRGLRERYGDLRAVNIVGFVHGGSMEFEDEPGRRYPALVMERCDWSLAHVTAADQEPALQSRRLLNTREGFLALLADMATAFKAVAALGGTGGVLVHRDVKPSNILAKDGRFLLADFGNVKTYRDDTRSLGGVSPSYVAPELWPAIRHQERFPDAEPPAMSFRAADIYSLGMTTVNVLTGDIPLRQKEHRLSQGPDLLAPQDSDKLRRVIAVLPGRMEVEDGCTIIPWRTSDEAALALFRRDLESLVLDMVRIAPDARPDAEEILRRVEALRACLRARPVRPNPSRPTPITPVPPAVRPVLRFSGERVSPTPVRARAEGLSRRTAAVAVAALGLLAAVSASAFAVMTAPVELVVETIAPLPRPGPGRWSGREDDHARPLCASGTDRSLVSGEYVVLDLSAVRRWPGQVAAPMAEIRLGNGARRPVPCAPMDADGRRWQCVGATDGLAGRASLSVTSAAGKAGLDIPFRIVAKGEGCASSLPAVARPDRVL